MEFRLSSQLQSRFLLYTFVWLVSLKCRVLCLEFLSLVEFCCLLGEVQSPQPLCIVICCQTLLNPLPFNMLQFLTGTTLFLPFRVYIKLSAWSVILLDAPTDKQKNSGCSCFKPPLPLLAWWDDFVYEHNKHFLWHVRHAMLWHFFPLCIMIIYLSASPSGIKGKGCFVFLSQCLSRGLAHSLKYSLNKWMKCLNFNFSSWLKNAGWFIQ